VTIVAATKYVSLADMRVLVDAGIDVVGENRAQDLEEKHAEYGDAFRWHFIGHLQSRKAKTVNELCELCHSLETESAARRLEIPALVEECVRLHPPIQGNFRMARRHTTLGGVDIQVDAKLEDGDGGGESDGDDDGD